MTLLDPPPVKSEKSRAMAFTVAAVTIAVIVISYFVFRYYPEERAARRFFSALVSGNTDLAYQLWKPAPSYTKKEFLADWGPGGPGMDPGYYGPVKSYEILKTCAPRGSSNEVKVSAAVSPISPMPDASDPEKSRKTKVVDVWVHTPDKSLGFPPLPASCSFF